MLSRAVFGPSRHTATFCNRFFYPGDVLRIECAPQDRAYFNQRGQMIETNNETNEHDLPSTKKSRSSRKKVIDPYRILPPHSKQELKALEESLVATGGLADGSGVILDSEGNIIDGHARRDICEKHGFDWLVGADVRHGLSNDDKRALAIRLNLARRGTLPTMQQRHQYVEFLLLADAEQSDQSIADVVGVDRSTVNRIRNRLVRSHKLTKVAATVGKDGRRRRVNSEKRKSVRFIARSGKECDRISSAMSQLKSIPSNGLIRRPNKLVTMLRREQSLEIVEKTGHEALPKTVELRHCDFRHLEIKPGTVDLIATDVVWGLEAKLDWEELAKLAKVWLKPTGLFATFIGVLTLPDLYEVVRPHLTHAWTFKLDFSGTSRSQSRNIVETWRPIPIFSRSGKTNFHLVSDSIQSGPPEKQYDDWQQPLSAVKQLVERLCPKIGSALVVDPQFGTGTTAVACAQLGKRFVGCDIDPKKVKIARHRVAVEGLSTAVG